MHLEDILVVIFDDIEQAGATPAIEHYIAAIQQNDSDMQLAAWNALDAAEQRIVKSAYIRGTRRSIAP
jgi:hypothetical protein